MLTTEELIEAVFKALAPSTTTYKQEFMLNRLVRQEVCVNGGVDDIYKEDYTLSIIVKSSNDRYQSFIKCIVSMDSELRFLDKGDRVEIKGHVVSIRIDTHEQYKVPIVTVDCRFNDNG